MLFWWFHQLAGVPQDCQHLRQQNTRRKAQCYPKLRERLSIGISNKTTSRYTGDDQPEQVPREAPRIWLCRYEGVLHEHDLRTAGSQEGGPHQGGWPQGSYFKDQKYRRPDIFCFPGELMKARLCIFWMLAGSIRALTYESCSTKIRKITPCARFFSRKLGVGVWRRGNERTFRFYCYRIDCF